VLYDDTPIHDKMESVQFPMIDVSTRVPSNGHGQLARESGRLTRRSKDILDVWRIWFISMPPGTGRIPGSRNAAAIDPVRSLTP